MRTAIAVCLLAGLSACTEPAPAKPSMPPDEYAPASEPAPSPSAGTPRTRDDVVAFLDREPIRLSDIGRYLVEQDEWETIQRYVAYRLLERLRRESGLTNTPEELAQRAQCEIRRGREQHGTAWAAFLRSMGQPDEAAYTAALARSRRLDEMLLNEKLFYRDVCRAGYSVIRLRYFPPGATEAAETVDRLVVSDAAPAPFLTVEGHAEILMAEPGDTLEVAPSSIPGRYVVDVLERHAPRDPAQAELARLAIEDPPGAHDLGLWVAHLLDTAQQQGRIRYADRRSERD
jgi:hypothetical protein